MGLRLSRNKHSPPILLSTSQSSRLSPWARHEWHLFRLIASSHEGVKLQTALFLFIVKGENWSVWTQIIVVKLQHGIWMLCTNDECVNKWLTSTPKEQFPEQYIQFQLQPQLYFFKFHLIYFLLVTRQFNFNFVVWAVFFPSGTTRSLTGPWALDMQQPQCLITFFFFFYYYHFLPGFLGLGFCYHADASMAHTVAKQCGTAALSLTTRSNNMTSFHISDIATWRHSGQQWMAFFPSWKTMLRTLINCPSVCSADCNCQLSFLHSYWQTAPSTKHEWPAGEEEGKAFVSPRHLSFHRSWSQRGALSDPLFGHCHSWC